MFLEAQLPEAQSWQLGAVARSVPGVLGCLLEPAACACVKLESDRPHGRGGWGLGAPSNTGGRSGLWSQSRSGIGLKIKQAVGGEGPPLRSSKANLRIFSYAHGPLGPC